MATTRLSPEARQFLPDRLALTASSASPMPRLVLYASVSLFAALLAWAVIGRLDVVAVADGRLIPQSYLKIVQPAEHGVVHEILVHEGERVAAGQILMRMDTKVAEADLRSLRHEIAQRSLQLRRIDAELLGHRLAPQRNDPPELFAQVQAQWAANRRALEDTLAQERAVLDKARQDRAAANEVRSKLEQTLPHFQAQEQAFARLAREGFAGPLLAQDKQRERIEKEQDLRTQLHAIQSASALELQAERKLTQIQSEYRQKLQAERVEAFGQHEKLKQELAKHEHKRTLLELRAPQDGTIKDLATHTPGTVVAPGTIMMTLVPLEDTLRAEVWVNNQDIGFVHADQPVKVKLAAFTFQKYGMLDGRVLQVSADAAEAPPAGQSAKDSTQRAGPPAYKALVELNAQTLERDGRHYPLSAGMHVAAEIKLGERSVMEYLLSPVQKAFQEAGRER
jgi:HlyD family secretion protein